AVTADSPPLATGTVIVARPSAATVAGVTTASPMDRGELTTMLVEAVLSRASVPNVNEASAENELSSPGAASAGTAAVKARTPLSPWVIAPSTDAAAGAISQLSLDATSAETLSMSASEPLCTSSSSVT